MAVRNHNGRLKKPTSVVHEILKNVLTQTDE